MSPEKVKKNQSLYDQGENKQKQNAIDKPYLQERSQWNVGISEAFKT